MTITGAFSSVGGIATLNRMVIRAFSDVGYQIDILALSETSSKPDDRNVIIPTNISYQTFNNQKITFSSTVWQSILKKTYDYVICDHVNLASILAPLSLFHHLRYIVWLHGVELLPPRPDFNGRIGLKFAWKRLANSDYTNKSIVDRFPHLTVLTCELGLDPDSYPVELPPKFDQHKDCGVQLDAIDGTSQRLGSRVILHVARMSSWQRHKGHDVLLQAFPSIYAKFPDVQLLLVGCGDDQARIRSLANSLPWQMQRAIFLPGYVNNTKLKQFYRSCYLFAMPSWGEGFGLVYLEAMAHAKTCLGGGVDAASCLIRDNKTGIIVQNPRSPEQVSTKICWLLERPEVAHQMGIAGYNLVRSKYLFPSFKDRFWRAIADD